MTFLRKSLWKDYFAGVRTSDEELQSDEEREHDGDERGGGQHLLHRAPQRRRHEGRDLCYLYVYKDFFVRLEPQT